MPDNRKSIANLRVLWAALLMGCCVEAVVAVVMGPSMAHGAVPQPIMLYALAGVSTVLAALSFWLPRTGHRDAIRRGRSRFEGLDTSRVITSAEQFSGPEHSAPNIAAARRHALRLFQVPMILSLALSNAITVFGLALAVLGFSPLQFGPFLAAGVLLVAIRFPTEADAFEPVERLLNVRLR